MILDLDGVREVTDCSSPGTSLTSFSSTTIISLKLQSKITKDSSLLMKD